MQWYTGVQVHYIPEIAYFEEQTKALARKAFSRNTHLTKSK